MLKIILLFPFVVLHIIAYLRSPQKSIIQADICRWKTIRNYVNSDHKIKSLIKLLIHQKDFRTQFYLRIGPERALLKFLLKPVPCDIEGDVFGEGLLLIHGYGIVVNGATKVGRNCTIYHGVTLGVANDLKEAPTIGDNVFIGCDAKILGGIHIGNNVKIGAGAIVVDDVPDNCTVIGPKAKYIHNETIHNL